MVASIARPERFPAAIATLLLASLCLGFATLTALPPWEGMDEYAHYSYLHQLATKGTVPRPGDARLSQRAERTLSLLPHHYASSPPFTQVRSFTYHDLARGTKGDLDEVRKVLSTPGGDAAYVPGKGSNWQRQHPPLYYAVMSPVYRVFENQSLGTRLLATRAVSFLLAWSALVIAVLALGKGWREQAEQYRWAPWAIGGIALWPLVIPSFHADMARLGNDSLCAFWLSLTLATLCGGSWSHCRLVGAGFLLGLGCLTKAIFLPIAVGVVAFVGFRTIRSEGLGASLRKTFLIGLPCFLCCGWWYGLNLVATGELTGSVEFGDLAAEGGMLGGLAERFSLLAFLRGHAAFLGTLGWTMSWSFARPPLWIVALPMLLIVVTIVGYGFSLLRSPDCRRTQLVCWVLIPLVAGFSYHVLARLALTGQGVGTPGYYLNLCAPLLGTMLGLAFFQATASKTLALVFKLLAAACGGLVIFGYWAQLGLFGGALHVTATDKTYRWSPEVGPSQAWEQLQALGMPTVSVVCWALAYALAFVGLRWLR